MTPRHHIAPPTQLRRSALALGLAAIMAGHGWPALAEAAANEAAGGTEEATGTETRVQARTLDAVEVQQDRELKDTYTVRRASTATKLGLSLRETPQSVTVITRQRLDDMGLFSLSDILAQVTGVFVSITDSERINYVSRGYNISNFQVDGMLNTFGGSVKTNTDSALYERIEVVRGATGLTTGAGDPSGTVNFVRKRPTDEFAMSAGITLGRWSNYRLEADIGGPIALEGRIRARAVVAKQQNDSFRDLYRQDKDVFYGIVQADLGERTLLEAGYEYQSPQTYGVTWGVLPYWNSDGTLAHLPRSTNLSASWSTWPIVEKTAFARLTHDFANGWSVKAVYSHADRDTDGRVYYGGNGYPNPDGSGITAWMSHFAYQEKMKTLDLNVSGPFQLFGRSHELLFGYGQSQRDAYTPAVYMAGDPYGNWPVPNYSIIADWRNWTGDVAPLPSVVRPYPASESELTQKAGYLATRLSLADPLSAVLGVRYGSWETRTWTYTHDANGNRTATRVTGYRPDDTLTPYAGVIFDFNDWLSAYASYTDIFQPQNYRDKDNEYLEPVVGDNWELGLKGEFFNGLLNASAAVFRGEKDNVAEVDDSVPINSLPDGSQAYRSTGKGNKVEGWELEVQGSLREGWNMAAGFTHATTRSQSGAYQNTTVPVDTFRLTTSWRPQGQWNKFSVGGGVTWQSKIYRENLVSGSWPMQPDGTYDPVSGLPNTKRSRIQQDAFYLLNLMAGYRFNDQFSVQFNVNNLLDKAYYNNVGFYNGVYWGEPRNYTLSLRWKL